MLEPRNENLKLRKRTCGPWSPRSPRRTRSRRGHVQGAGHRLDDGRRDRRGRRAPVPDQDRGRRDRQLQGSRRRLCAGREKLEAKSIDGRGRVARASAAHGAAGARCRGCARSPPCGHAGRPPPRLKGRPQMSACHMRAGGFSCYSLGHARAARAALRQGLPGARLSPGRARDPAASGERAHLREDARQAGPPRGTSSSTRAPRRPTACRTTGTSSRASSRISSPATRRCAATACPRKAGLGHARPARRGRGREGAAHPRQGGHRAVRRRALRQEVHRVRLPVHAASGRSSPSASLSGATSATPTSPTTARTWRACGGRCRALREGPPLPGPQGRLVVGAGRDGAQLGRGGAGVQDRRRPERVRRVPAGCGRGRTSSLLVWTTTPWTLPSNMYAAVHAGLRLRRRAGQGRQAVRRRRGPGRGAREEARRARRSKTRATEGRATSSAREYRAAVRASTRAAATRESPTRRTDRSAGACLAADFVTLDTGTGIVHIAPAFGEDDHELSSARGRARSDAAGDEARPALSCAG